MGWFGVFPRTGRNDLFVAPVNRDTNKNVCPHIATKTWPRNRRFLFGKVCRFFVLNFLRAFIVKQTHMCVCYSSLRDKAIPFWVRNRYLVELEGFFCFFFF